MRFGIILLICAAIAESAHAPQIGRSQGSPVPLPTTRPDPVEVKKAESEPLVLPSLPLEGSRDQQIALQVGGSIFTPDFFQHRVPEVSLIAAPSSDQWNAVTPAVTLPEEKSPDGGGSVEPIPSVTIHTPSDGDITTPPSGEVQEEPAVPSRQPVAGSASAIPEPGSISIVVLSAAGLLRRERS